MTTIECRDWTTTLWPASYMGVPFFFDRDESSGGRDLGIHEPPHAEQSFVEDMGRKTRTYEGTGYVHGDDADTQALNLESIFETEGPGTLVVPIQGPVQVHCESFRRTADKDKFGFIAFSLKFVIDGAPQALTSTAMLGQGVFDSADEMASSIADLFPGALVLNNVADYVLAAAIDAVQGIATSIELVRTSNPCDATISAQVAAADAAITQAAPLLLAFEDPADPIDVANLLSAVPDIDNVPTDPSSVLAASIVATIRLLAEGLQGNADAGAGAMLGLALDFAPVTVTTALSVNATAAAANTASIAALARLAAFTAWCEALQRKTYNSRPDGVAARAAVAERLEFELDNWSGLAGAEVFSAIEDLQGSTVQFLTQLIANLAPVVTVSAPQSMPAFWWAWRLYGDPTRAFDLVLRNDVVHPSFMPTEFMALAPNSPAPSSLPTSWPAP